MYNLVFEQFLFVSKPVHLFVENYIFRYTSIYIQIISSNPHGFGLIYIALGRIQLIINLIINTNILNIIIIIIGLYLATFLFKKTIYSNIVEKQLFSLYYFILHLQKKKYCIYLYLLAIFLHI